MEVIDNIDTEKFMNKIVLDGLNNVFYFKVTEGFTQVHTPTLKCMLVNNSVSGKIEDIEINNEIARNLTGNNVYYGFKRLEEGKIKKTRGLLYQDFFLYDNMLILLHGKVVSLIDIMEKTQKPIHLTLNNDNSTSEDHYYFGHDPVAVWIQDKPE